MLYSRPKTFQHGNILSLALHDENKNNIELDFDIFWHFIGYLVSAYGKQKKSSSRTLSHQLPSPKNQQNDGIVEVKNRKYSLVLRPC